MGSCPDTDIDPTTTLPKARENAGKRGKTRENAGNQVMIGFSFVPD